MEEIEDRFTSDQRHDILNIISAHLPIDREAIRAFEDRNDALQTNADQVDQRDVIFDDQDGEEVYVGPEDDSEQQGMADPDDDMNMLENEAPGGTAIDDEGQDD